MIGLTLTCKLDGTDIARRQSITSAPIPKRLSSLSRRKPTRAVHHNDGSIGLKSQSFRIRFSLAQSKSRPRTSARYFLLSSESLAFRTCESKHPARSAVSMSSWKCELAMWKRERVRRTSMSFSAYFAFASSLSIPLSLFHASLRGAPNSTFSRTRHGVDNLDVDADVPLGPSGEVHDTRSGGGHVTVGRPAHGNEGQEASVQSRSDRRRS